VHKQCIPIRHVLVYRQNILINIAPITTMYTIKFLTQFFTKYINESNKEKPMLEIYHTDKTKHFIRFLMKILFSNKSILQIGPSQFQLIED
jgi:hypothetical protein